MAKAKQPTLDPNYKSYFFLSVCGKDGVHVVYEDGDNKAIFAAAFASAIAEDDELFEIFSTAILTVMDPGPKPTKKKAK